MRIALAIAVLGLGVAVPLLAHHSLAEYDSTRVATIRGAVTSVDWRNPHVRIHVDVKSPDGQVVNWNVETWGTGQLAVRGLTNGFLKPNDRVRIAVFLAKDGTARAVVRTLTLPDGQTVDGPPVDFTSTR
jgi:hypothetical protein